MGHTPQNSRIYFCFLSLCFGFYHYDKLRVYSFSMQLVQDYLAQTLKKYQIRQGIVCRENLAE